MFIIRYCNIINWLMLAIACLALVVVQVQQSVAATTEVALGGVNSFDLNRNEQHVERELETVGQLKFVPRFEEHRHQKSEHRRLRNRRRKMLTANKRRLIPPQSDAFNDYLTVTIGKSVVLDCKLESYTNDKVVWVRMPKGEILTLNSDRVTLEPRIYSECHKDKNPCWSLHIQNTIETDSGYYVCQTNTMQTKYIYLDVLVPPKLINYNPINRIDVDQNSNVTLICDVYGKPTPQIYWYRYVNGTPYEMEKYQNLNSITLLIRRESTNEYECVADNGVPPTVSKKIYLNIRLSPKISFMNNLIYQKRDRDVIFDCIVHSNPEPIIEWHRNNSKLADSEKYNLVDFRNGEFYYYRLYIKALNNEDFGEYHCVAQNSIGVSRSKIDLVELVIPTTTTTTTTTTTITTTMTTTTIMTTTITSTFVPTTEDTTTEMPTTTTTVTTTQEVQNEDDNQIIPDEDLTLAKVIKHKSSGESTRNEVNHTSEISKYYKHNKNHEKSRMNRLKGHRNFTHHSFSKTNIYDEANKASCFNTAVYLDVLCFLMFSLLYGIP